MRRHIFAPFSLARIRCLPFIELRKVARRFIDLASRFLERAMLPLMLGVAFDLGKTPGFADRLETLAVNEEDQSTTVI